MRWPVRFGFFALFLLKALAQTQPDVAEILKKVSETYKAASQYQFVVDLTSHSSAAGGAETSHMLLAFKAPNRYRIEGGIPGMGFDNPEFREGVIVHDGSAVWFYLPKSNQYGSSPASALSADAPGDLDDLRPEAVDHFMMGQYRGASDFANRSKFLRTETIEIGGAKIACYVVMVSPERDGSASTSTWWVDQKRYRVVRVDSTDSSVVYTDIKLDEPLPDELFRFKPPPDARKIEMQQ